MAIVSVRFLPHQGSEISGYVRKNWLFLSTTSITLFFLQRPWVREAGKKSTSGSLRGGGEVKGRPLRIFFYICCNCKKISYLRPFFGGFPY